MHKNLGMFVSKLWEYFFSKKYIFNFKKSHIVSILSFCLFILFMGFSKQEYWSGLLFPSPVDRIFSELSTMTCPSWVASHGMARSFIDLDKAVVHVIRLVSFLCWWFSVCALWWRRIRGLWKLPDGIDWLRGILGLVLWVGSCSVNL